MAQLNATDTVALQLEAVNPDLPRWLEEEAVLEKRLTKKAKRVSTRLFRVPGQHALPGAIAKTNLDGGDFVRGGHSQYDVGTVTPLAIVMPLELSQLAKMTGKGDNVSIVNVVQENIADLMKAMATFRDIFLNTDGTGKIGVISAIAGTLITIATNALFGSANIKKQQTVQFFNGNALVGSAQVLDVQSELGATQTITVDGVPGGTAVGNIIRVDGVEDGAPVFVNGIPYFYSTSTAGSVQGISKANNYVVATGVNAASASITQPMKTLARNKIRQQLGEKGLKKAFAHMHLSQADSWEQLALPMMNVFLDGQVKNFDPTVASSSMGGDEIVQSVHADRTRIDFLSPEIWGKVCWNDGSFWYDLDGMKVFPVPGSAAGTWSSGFISYMIDTLQYFLLNFKAASSITSLGVPFGN